MRKKSVSSHYSLSFSFFPKMPKASRRAPKAQSTKTPHQTEQYYYLVFGQYRSGESGRGVLSIDFAYHQCFVPREFALFNLYKVAMECDNNVIQGSMQITGIQTLTAEQRTIWRSTTGLLQQAGLDNAISGSVSAS